MTHWLAPVPFLLLLFILPFPGTVALRLLCLVAAFIIAAVMWRRLNPPPFPGKAVFAFWIAVALFSLTYAVDPAYSLGEIKNEIGYSILALFAFFAFSRDERMVRQGALAVVMSLTVIAVWSLWWQARMGYWQENAGYGGIGSYTGLVLMAVPAFFLLWQWQRRTRVFVIVVALVAVLAGAYSLQRVLWPALGIELGTLVLLLRSKDGVTMTGRRAAALLAVTAAFVLILLMATQGARIIVNGPAIELDNDVRLRHWPAVVERILDRPMIGVGFGRNAMKLGHPDLVVTNTPFWHAHNVFLNYGLAMGLPGMIALLSLFVSLSLTYWQMYRSSDPTLVALGIAGLLLLIGVLARNLSNDFFQRDVALLFWSMNGLFLGYGLRLQRTRSRAMQ